MNFVVRTALEDAGLLNEMYNKTDNHIELICALCSEIDNLHNRIDDIEHELEMANADNY